MVHLPGRPIMHNTSLDQLKALCHPNLTTLRLAGLGTCYRKPVCLSSVVVCCLYCNVHALYSAGWNLFISTAFCTLDIRWPTCIILRRSSEETLRRVYLYQTRKIGYAQWTEIQHLVFHCHFVNQTVGTWIMSFFYMDPCKRSRKTAERCVIPVHVVSLKVPFLVPYCLSCTPPLSVLLFHHSL